MKKNSPTTHRVPDATQPPLSARVHSQGSTQAGFLTVQSMAALLAFLMLLTGLAAAWNFGMGVLRGRSAAQQLVTVAEAAQQYARVKGLLDSLTPGAEATAITTTDLSTEGFLPAPAPSASGTVLTNPWGQHYTVYFHLPVSTPPAAPRLTVVVLTEGGEALSEGTISFVSMAGASAGVVSEPASGDKILRGVAGGYALPLEKTPMNIPSPGEGHVGYYITLDDTALLSDTLYRVAVPGRPELSQMRVTLDMTDNSIVNTKSVQFNATSVKTVDLNTICGTTAEEKTAAEGKVFFYTGAGAEGSADHSLDGLYACRAGAPQQLADSGNSSLMRTATTVASGTSINAPACPNGLTPFISVSPATLPTDMVTGDTLHSSYTGTGPWTVQLAHYDKEGAPKGTEGGTLSVITSCGRVAP